MSEVTPEGEQQQNGGNNSGWTPPATQDDLNRIISERVQRERAKYADYEDLKGKAARFAEIEDAQKSEAEKTAERLSKAEQRAAEAEAKAVRRELALEHGLTKDDAALLDGVTDEGAMKALAARLAAGAAQQRKNGNHVSREGTTTSTGTKQGDDERTFVRSLFGGGTT